MTTINFSLSRRSINGFMEFAVRARPCKSTTHSLACKSKPGIKAVIIKITILVCIIWTIMPAITRRERSSSDLGLNSYPYIHVICSSWIAVITNRIPTNFLANASLSRPREGDDGLAGGTQLGKNRPTLKQHRSRYGSLPARVDLALREGSHYLDSMSLTVVPVSRPLRWVSLICLSRVWNGISSA